ncbi:tyrosine-type recombinase/integrase [Virgibacillus halophilus]|uniref:Tyrosine-type recombinase/integrase n=1 Tax=Tigheibacillus halophilus TaxID=361280 RepID=A0ABU5C831_9BACI|nr:tyrosine-type recombinase/integrase [Virgibacillus halophilus]
MGTEYHNEKFIFVTSRYADYPIYPKIIQQRMARILKLAKLNEELTPHSLRHTHTSLLAEAGVSIERIMERQGHSDDETTKQVYLHTTDAVRKQDAKKFGNLIKNVLKIDK